MAACYSRSSALPNEEVMGLIEGHFFIKKQNLAFYIGSLLGLPFAEIWILFVTIVSFFYNYKGTYIMVSFRTPAEVMIVDLNSFNSFGRGDSVVTTRVDWRPLWTQLNNTELPDSSTQKSTIRPSRTKLTKGKTIQIGKFSTKTQ